MSSALLLLGLWASFGTAFEWAGIFETPKGEYLWTAQKVNGEYADPTMGLVALPAPDATAATLDKLADEGKRLLEGECMMAESLSVIVPRAACYRLHFEQSMWQSFYHLHTNGTAFVAFFAEHFPTEFEASAHYLKDKDGTDIEPVAELPKEAPPAKPWAASVGAALLVNIMTLSGVVFLAPVMSSAIEKFADTFTAIMSAFAAGAILACAFFLLLFEATHLITEGGYENEADVIWRWGTMILAGFLLPAVIDFCIQQMGGHGHEAAAADPTTSATTDTTGTAVEEVSVEVKGGAGQPNQNGKSRVLAGVLIGDFFHNLCDGFFIGFAFTHCGGVMGWGVATATIVHELAQEIADYVILTSPQHGGLRPLKALALNFISGLSVMLGVIIILSVDVANESVGLFLAFGGGVYVHIGAAECMPKVYSLDISKQARFWCLFAFALGAAVIGLVLLDHEHCIPEGAGGHHH